MTDYAAQRYGHVEGVRFQTADVADLPFPSRSAHGLAAVSLAGCLADPAAFFREAGRVIQPGGWAVMTFTNRLSLLLRVNGWLQRLARRPGDGFRYRLYSAGEIRRLASTNGWRVERLDYYNCFVNLGDWLLPPAQLATCLEHTPLRFLGRNLLAVLRRSAAEAADRGSIH